MGRVDVSGTVEGWRFDGFQPPIVALRALTIAPMGQGGVWGG